MKGHQGDATAAAPGAARTSLALRAIGEGRTGLLAHLPATVWSAFAAFVVLVGIVSTEGGIRVVRDAWMEGQRQTVQSRLVTARARLEAEVGSATQIAIGLTNLLSLKPDLTQDEFVSVLARILPRAQTVKNIALAPDNVVRMVHPPENVAVLGLRYLPGSAQWPAVRDAISKRSIILDGPRELVQGGVGLIVRSPVYIDDGVDDRRYWGLVSLVLDNDAVFRNAGLATSALGLRMVVMGDQSYGVGQYPLLGDPSVLKETPVRVPVTIPDGVWTLAAVPESGWSRFTVETLAFRFAGYGFFIAIGAIAFLLARTAERNEKLALSDALTGLANRRRFTADLERACDQASADSGPFVFVIDLDAFKPINDNHGHAAGDAILRGIGQRFRDGLPPGCIAGRVGGDEFTVLAPASIGTPPELFARRLATLVDAPVHVGGVELSVGCSIGWARHGVDGVSAESLFATADARMYAEKQRMKSAEIVAGTADVGRDVYWLDA